MLYAYGFKYKSYPLVVASHNATLLAPGRANRASSLPADLLVRASRGTEARLVADMCVALVAMPEAAELSGYARVENRDKFRYIITRKLRVPLPNRQGIMHQRHRKKRPQLLTTADVNTLSGSGTTGPPFSPLPARFAFFLITQN